MALLSNHSSVFPEAGCDEAGRGCLAGPVVAAAVVFPKDYSNELINDSKKLSERKRNVLVSLIKSEAISYAIGFVAPNEIDEINILNASFLAMHRALEMLEPKPNYLIIDGNRFNSWHDVPYATIIKGDGKYLSIAAASILAKTARDEYMKTLHQEYPDYQWNKNKGYPTQSHIRAIDKCGFTPHHRRSFHLKRQLKLDL
jgi:ribonuclease HII